MRQREVLDFIAEVRRGMSNLVERLDGMERLITAQGNANEQAEEPNLRPNPPHHHAQEEHPVNDRNPPGANLPPDIQSTLSKSNLLGLKK